MAVSQAQIGYGTVLGRRGATLTTIAGAITLNSSPQVVTPAAMTSIVVGSILAIDTGTPAVLELVQVSAVTGTTFTAIFQNSHAGGINIALHVPILEIIKIAGPGMKADLKEVSNMMSPSAYKEFIVALREGGDVTFEGNYIPKEATLSQQTLRTDFESGVVSAWCIALPTAGTGIWSFQGYVMALTPAYPLDDRITVTGTMRITAKPVLF
ncbi:MAG TPA: phage tail tube protein [Candidatus Dormibacteraeota bacterium]|nr:phage tail tube protein [Candidatus Dormibacteraeota bacterium]